MICLPVFCMRYLAELSRDLYPNQSRRISRRLYASITAAVNYPAMGGPGSAAPQSAGRGHWLEATRARLADRAAFGAVNSQPRRSYHDETHPRFLRSRLPRNRARLLPRNLARPRLG